MQQGRFSILRTPRVVARNLRNPPLAPLSFAPMPSTLPSTSTHRQVDSRTPRAAGFVRWAAIACFTVSAAAQETPPETLPQDPPPAREEVQDVPVQQHEETTQGRRARRLTRPRRARDDDGPTRARVGGGIGYGDFHINASELGQHDDEDAIVLRLDVDFWINRHIGFGVNSELVGTGDDLFAGQQVESGVGPRAADAQVSAHDLAFYFQWDPFAGDGFRLPLQVGPWFAGTTLDYDEARIDYQIVTAGVRVGARPEWKMLDRDKVDLVAFAGASYAVGFTSIDEDRIGSDETFDSASQQFRAEAGVRVDLRRMYVGFHFVHSDTGINLSDVEAGRRLPEIDFYTNMFFVTVGGRF
jgi:hypothetical protein